MAQNDTIKVRTAAPHGIYKEQGYDGGVPVDIHVTGYDPEDGQIIRHPETGAELTPIFEVPRTQGVLAAIGEKRLIDVDRDATPGALTADDLQRQIDAARTLRASARPPTAPQSSSVTLTREELDARLQAARQEGQRAAESDAMVKSKVGKDAKVGE